MKKIYGVRCEVTVWDNDGDKIEWTPTVPEVVVDRIVAAFPDEEKTKEYLKAFNFSEHFSKEENKIYPDEAYLAFDPEGEHQTVTDTTKVNRKQLFIISTKVYKQYDNGDILYDYNITSSYWLSIVEIPYYDI